MIDAGRFRFKVKRIGISLLAFIQKIELRFVCIIRIIFTFTISYRIIRNHEKRGVLLVQIVLSSK